MGHDEKLLQTNIRTELGRTIKDHNATGKKGAIKVLGIDLAKKSFQLHGVGESGRVVVKKKLSESDHGK